MQRAVLEDVHTSCVIVRRLGFGYGGQGELGAISHTEQNRCPHVVGGHINSKQQPGEKYFKNAKIWEQTPLLMTQKLV